MTSTKSKSVEPVPVRALLLTAVTMAFFAANSLLARLALRTGEIDAGSFTAIRIVSGAAALLLVTDVRRKEKDSARWQGSLGAAFALFLYAIGFSYAYLSLEAGTGALLLFLAVQVTMFGMGIARGERPWALEWIGLALALAGLVYLVSPGLRAPSPVGVLLMTVAGASWGYYSLAAKGVRSPIAATAGNFVRAAPFAAGALAVAWIVGRPHASWAGVGLAAASGVAASGLGYALWYVALKDLRTSFAALVQLTVPVLAAGGGALLLGEGMTWRLTWASAAILSGVAIALLGRIRNG